MKILVTGACGYKGSVLVPKLLQAGHQVVGLDLQWFGNHLEPHRRLTLIRGDVRAAGCLDLSGTEAIIHLASVANDPCGDLDPTLTWEIGCLATMQLAEQAVRAGVGQFIFASSGSVYGVSDAPEVTEDIPLSPLSAYNKTKMCAERVLLSYGDNMRVQVVRPATVCGFSPRMRLDVSVNMLTMQALTGGRITIFGGDQIRPNIHIEDVTDLYLFLLDNPQHTGIFNAGFENLSILEIAARIAGHIPAEIVRTGSADPRSYRLNADRLLAAGFRPRRCVDDAVRELAALYLEGVLRPDPRASNLAWMRQEIVA